MLIFLYFQIVDRREYVEVALFEGRVKVHGLHLDSNPVLNYPILHLTKRVH